MAWDEERRLIRVAKLYYEDELKQSEIAKLLDVDRTTVTRMLQKARQEGIVHITIQGNHTAQVELEESLRKLFQLKEVMVLPTNSSQSTEERKKDLGKETMQWLNRTIQDEDVVGFAWGSTLGSIVETGDRFKRRQGDIVPVVGGPGKMPTTQHVNTIAYSAARMFQAQAHFIDAAAIVPSIQTRKDLYEANYFQDILKLWRKLTIAVVGIGSPINSSNLIFSGFLGNDDYKQLENENAIGDICSRFYTIDGKIIRGEIDQRTVAVELEQLKTTPWAVGVAESVEKAGSILGALRGGFINTLITNDETAEAILELAKEQ